MERPADTTHPLHDLIRRRWSPRAFSDRAVEHDDVMTLLEAARWAPSSFNEQPWRFLVARRTDTEPYGRILSCLVSANQIWAATAPVLMLTLACTIFRKNGKPNPHAWHDVGLAMGNMTMQAMSMGLFVHQMAGIDTQRIRTVYALPPEFEPVTAVALGYVGDPAVLPTELAQKEVGPRSRRSLSETVFGDRLTPPSRPIG